MISNGNRVRGCGSVGIAFHVPCITSQFTKYVDSNFIDCRAESRFAPSHWEAALLCNAVSHWLGESLESALDWYRCGKTTPPITNPPPGHSRTQFHHHTERCRYNAVNFLPKYSRKTSHSSPVRTTYNVCLIWVQPLIDILPRFLQRCVQNRVILDRVITASHCL